ncbi:branched-chain amino acid ABC transporter permease [Bradyrhizobium sp. NP1]|uniref:branched-chain amino acid ABC transporter permease n=1 Tax=Bradyrhizobium sp. NP1 TaxID=3049772 RepID=UPI0025A68DD2|nr:branched-chain amino acid ABC transporter permease [Bradyrhizobium sp. NP1]WJR79231.1 branched-chain amino acid ABC transporter permease [Bradyrhizobium sp. NP1]
MLSHSTTIIIDGISYAAWLFTISIGLTLVFGVLRILNIAHGGFYSFGAYAAAYAIGIAGANGFGMAAQFAFAATLAIVIGVLIGIVVERSVLRQLYHHQEVMVLFATYAVFLILEDATKLIWGGQSLYANGPRDALGQVRLGELLYPVYDVVLILVACVLAFAVSFALNSTRVGRCVTAVVFDRELSASMGINVNRIMMGTFLVGAALGSFAGAITAPKIAVSSGIGVEVIVLAFAVVVIGGLGSIGGAAVGAIIVGLARATTAHLFPQIELFAVYAAMAAVLAVKPHGLFARPEARRI